MRNNLLAFYGLKWNPFSPQIPVEACLAAEAITGFGEKVCLMAHEGGFALLTGEPGTGKSVALRILAERMKTLRDVEVRALTRPQCSVADFYRELGNLFGVTLSPSNRWAGAKVLRERWWAHIEKSLVRPVLLVDEAQEMTNAVFIEMRLLSSADLDSRSLLTTVLAGDERLPARLGTPALASLGTRCRARLRLLPRTPQELAECLRHGLAEAGQAGLMTDELIGTLSERAGGNLRVMMNLA